MLTRIAAAALIAAIGLTRLRRVVVQGASMVPVLLPGDRVATLPLGPQPGRLAVLTDPRSSDRVLVKRVVAVEADGRVRVRGDNSAASTDSRHFGPVPRALVLGRPVYRYHPPERAGWLWSA
ncbi:MAG TPA: S26 family signal peptidase [Euzebya sp.]|nr:S26 family signal peptidase [Euzebya sp.]